MDQGRRRAVVEQALNDPKVQSKIAQSGKQLALAVDGFVVSSRRRLAGSFVEKLVALRATPIDLSKEPECKNLADSTRLPSGAPSAAFVTCWKAAWSHLQDAAGKLVTAADRYDTLADAGDVNAQKLFATILADYDLISAGKADASNLFWNDVTQFITFANAISSAASKPTSRLYKTNWQRCRFDIGLREDDSTLSRRSRAWLICAGVGNGAVRGPDHGPETAAGYCPGGGRSAASGAPGIGAESSAGEDSDGGKSVCVSNRQGRDDVGPGL